MLNQKISEQQWAAKLFLAVCLLCVVLALAITSGNPHSYENVVKEGTLKVITRNSPTTYYQDRDQESGFEFELAQLFAQYLGVKLEVEVADSLDDLITKVESGEVALAAAGLTKTEDRQLRFNLLMRIWMLHKSLSIALTANALKGSKNYSTANLS